MAEKNKQQRNALFKAFFCLMLLSTACCLVLIWASRDAKSPLAKSIRGWIGIREPAPVVEELPIVEVPAPEVVEVTPEPMQPIMVEPEPDPIIDITFGEITKLRHLWPRKLQLNLAAKITIRFNGNTYGDIEFAPGTVVQVQALKSPAHVECTLGNNFTTIPVYETDFAEWFTDRYSEKYTLQPIPKVDNTNDFERATFTRDEREKAVWNQMNIWCHKNYDSIALTLDTDKLIFKWHATSDSYVDYSYEAREIARKFLQLRSELGKTDDNYAACEIHHPRTDELLGSGAVFIPQL